MMNPPEYRPVKKMTVTEESVKSSSVAAPFSHQKDLSKSNKTIVTWSIFAAKFAILVACTAVICKNWVLILTTLNEILKVIVDVVLAIALISFLACLPTFTGVLYLQKNARNAKITSNVFHECTLTSFIFGSALKLIFCCKFIMGLVVTSTGLWSAILTFTDVFYPDWMLRTYTEFLIFIIGVALSIALLLFREFCLFWIRVDLLILVEENSNNVDKGNTSIFSSLESAARVIKTSLNWCIFSVTVLTLSILMAAFLDWKNMLYSVWVQWKHPVISVIIGVSLAIALILLWKRIFFRIRLYLQSKVRNMKNLFNVGQKPSSTSPILGKEQNLAEVLKKRIETEATREKIIGPKGGSVENFGCKITFPAGAVERESKLKTSVITDFSGSPKGMAPIAPILQCVLDNKLELPVMVEMRSWVCPSESEVQSHLYRKDKGSDWTFVKFVRLTSDAKFIFSAQHFTDYGVFGVVGGICSRIQTVLGWPWPHFVRAAVSSRVERSLGLPMRLKIFLRTDYQGVVALVCCVSHPKVIADVESSLKDCHYTRALLIPEIRMVPQSERLSVIFTCHYPNTLKIWKSRDRVQSTERNIKVSELLNKMQHQEYFPLEINGEDLVDYEGKIKASLSLKNGGTVRHPISKRWPIPE